MRAWRAARRKKNRRGENGSGAAAGDVVMHDVLEPTIVPLSRDEVFVAGGQPSVTYVEREELHIERSLARALASPNQIVSLSGPTKSGKTVLCRRVLMEHQYVWLEGGQAKSADEIWRSVCRELNFPIELTTTDGNETSGGLTLQLPFVTSINGSRLHSSEISRTFEVSSMSAAIKHCLENRIVIVIDDFHYLSPDTQLEFLRNIKGAVFGGLKLLLMSVNHRAFDAIRAESELTGRFTSISMPEWSVTDLEKIPHLGFHALNVACPINLVGELTRESQQSPFLMQQFCWEICYDCGINFRSDEGAAIPSNYDLHTMFERLAGDAGLPIYQKLVAGPQAKKERLKRPLREGDEADVYEATLSAIAHTGPKSPLTYDEIRTSLVALLADKVPQKHEVTSALKHLSKISAANGSDQGLDWDDDSRQLNITDPYLRFYLRWQVRRLEE